MKKNIADKNDWNLYNLNRPLYDIIDKYGISHTYLAKLLYPEDWAKAEAEDAEAKAKQEAEGNKKITRTYHVHKVAGGLRNKLDGRGKLTLKEHKKLFEAIDEMLQDIHGKMGKAAGNLEEDRDNRIKSLFDGFDEDTIEGIKDKL